MYPNTYFFVQVYKVLFFRGTFFVPRMPRNSVCGPSCCPNIDYYTDRRENVNPFCLIGTLLYGKQNSIHKNGAVESDGRNSTNMRIPHGAGVLSIKRKLRQATPSEKAYAAASKRQAAVYFCLGNFANIMRLTCAIVRYFKGMTEQVLDKNA